MNYDSIEEAISVKNKLVAEFGKSIQGKKVGHNEDGGRNFMAKVVCFQIYRQGFVDFLSKLDLKTPTTNSELSQIHEWLHELMGIINCGDETWAEFWRGNQPIKPNKIPFFDTDKNESIFVDLNEMNDFVVQDMGYR